MKFVTLLSNFGVDNLKDLFHPLVISYRWGKKTAMEQGVFISPDINICSVGVWPNRTLSGTP